MEAIVATAPKVEPVSETAPANIEAEAAILGACLQPGGAAAQIVPQLEQDDFAEPLHQRIFAAVAALVGEGRQPTPILLKPMLEHDDTLREVGVGYLARLASETAASLAPMEYVEQIRELTLRRRQIAAADALIDAARDPFRPLAEVRALAAQIGNTPAEKVRLRATSYEWRQPDELPRRAWLQGRQLLRGSVFVVIAPGATGKTSLMIGTALANCTGRSLLGQSIWGGPGRVWLWNLEDALPDIQFSVQAAALHWGIAADDIADRLYVDSGLNGAALKLARSGRDGPLIDESVVSQIVSELQNQRIDLLIIDPFVSSHGLADENDNAGIDLVAKAWSRIATEAQCAVVLVHHARKSNGGEISAESARGASALVDAARGGLALNTMTQAEAERFGIPSDQRRRFFRADDAKPNRAPPGVGQWFEIVSVHLGNGPNGGDSVGVATPWSPPDPFADVTIANLKAVLAKVADGGWRKDAQSPDWVGSMVGEVLELDVGPPQKTDRTPTQNADRKRVQAIIDMWIANGALRVEERPDQKRKLKEFIAVGSSPV